MNKTEHYRIQDENDWLRFGAELLKRFPNTAIFLLSGDLGVGKTTLVNTLCKLLQVVDRVQSPTFSIINEYRTDSGKRIVHMDLYRIKTSSELREIGLDEYILSGDYCFIEWPELLMEHIAENYISVYIEHADNNTRTVNLNYNE